MGRLGVKERRFLAEILHGFITRDYRRTAEVHFESGYVPPHHSVDNFAQAIRAIGEPIHNRTAEDISMARLLTLLFEVTGLFDMRTRPELLLLQKTMVVVEGVGARARSQARHLDGRRAGGARMDDADLGPAGKLEGAAGAAEIAACRNAPGPLHAARACSINSTRSPRGLVRHRKPSPTSTKGKGQAAGLWSRSG